MASIWEMNQHNGEQTRTAEFTACVGDWFTRGNK